MAEVVGGIVREPRGLNIHSLHLASSHVSISRISVLPLSRCSFTFLFDYFSLTVQLSPISVHQSPKMV
jgi:hypothetical protein